LIKRGDIFYADLGDTVGSEQKGVRPVLVVQNDIGNKYSSTVIILPITSKLKNQLPTHVGINGEKYGLDKDSTILAEQIRTIDKVRLKDKIGSLDFSIMVKVKEALKISFSIRCEFEELFGKW
jgi:mRNA interferase MazF